MQRAELVHMANQIAAYYAAYPQAEAIDGVRSHLQRFWTQAMRRQLAAHPTDPALAPLVRAAIAGLPTDPA